MYFFACGGVRKVPVGRVLSDYVAHTVRSDVNVDYQKHFSLCLPAIVNMHVRSTFREVPSAKGMSGFWACPYLARARAKRPENSDENLKIIRGRP